MSYFLWRVDMKWGVLNSQALWSFSIIKVETMVWCVCVCVCVCDLLGGGCERVCVCVCVCVLECVYVCTTDVCLFVFFSLKVSSIMHVCVCVCECIMYILCTTFV